MDLTETTETMVCTNQINVVLVQDVDAMGITALDRAVESAEVTDWAAHVPINDALGSTALTRQDITCN